MSDNEKNHPQMRVDNLACGQLLVTDGRVADRHWTRMRGLICHPPLAPDEALLTVPCSSVHSHSMAFCMDVVYVDKVQQVVGIERNLHPRRFGHFYRRVHYVVEVLAGAAAAIHAQAGDQLRVQGYRL